MTDLSTMQVVDAWLLKMGLVNNVNDDQRETLESFGDFLKAACATPADHSDRDKIIEECAMVCRARITGTRRVADIEAAECMKAIRALYLPPPETKAIEEWA